MVFQLLRRQSLGVIFHTPCFSHFRTSKSCWVSKVHHEPEHFSLLLCQCSQPEVLISPLTVNLALLTGPPLPDPQACFSQSSCRDLFKEKVDSHHSIEWFPVAVSVKPRFPTPFHEGFFSLFSLAPAPATRAFP